MPADATPPPAPEPAATPAQPHPLEARLCYTFQRSALLQEALSHPSIRHEKKALLPDNQRLEFLGDAVLQMLSTEMLFEDAPTADEGELTQRRANLVSRTAMCDLARSLNLGEFLIMGRGEEASGGRNRPSTLADAMESIIGAIYIDGGWTAAHTFRSTVLEPFWKQTTELVRETNPKGKLQEILQALGTEPPQYNVIAERGPDHAREFTVALFWRGTEICQGTGNSKKEAETAAALQALTLHPWDAEKA